MKFKELLAVLQSIMQGDDPEELVACIEQWVACRAAESWSPVTNCYLDTDCY